MIKTLPAALALIVASSNLYAQRVGSAGVADIDLTGYEMVADRRVAYVTHVGAIRPEVMTVDSGRSDGVPLTVALRLVAPPGWRAAVSRDFGGDPQVSWTEGSTWAEALEQIGKQTGLTFTVHWARQTIAADPLPAVARQTMRSELLSARDDARRLTDEREARELEALASQPAATATDVAALAQMERDALAGSGGVDTFAIADPDFGPGAIAPAPGGTPPRTYSSLNEFLQEEIEVDVASVDFVSAVRASLPSNWEIDERVPVGALSSSIVDLTAVDTRGAILNAVALEHDVTIIPFVQFSKVIVTSKE